MRGPIACQIDSDALLALYTRKQNVFLLPKPMLPAKDWTFDHLVGIAGWGDAAQFKDGSGRIFSQGWGEPRPHFRCSPRATLVFSRTNDFKLFPSRIFGSYYHLIQIFMNENVS